MNPVHFVDTPQALPLQWPGQIHRLRTRSSQATQPKAYVVGSCRYLRLTAGIAADPHLGDRMFATISRLVEQADPPVSAMLMTGDQIYVDDLNLIADGYNNRQMPVYFVTNASVEKQIPIPLGKGKRVALRIGVTNLFNRFNPRYVNSNISSPYFLGLSDSSARHFSARVRLLKR